MNLSEQVAEAKKMHWGMYCGICDTCTKEALCSIACPDGGIEDGQTYGEKSVMPWNVLGKLDDGTYKGKCGNCGFVHYFIEGHDAQYRFCPQCGEQKREL